MVQYLGRPIGQKYSERKKNDDLVSKNGTLY